MPTSQMISPFSNTRVHGYKLISDNKVLTLNNIIEIQEKIEHNKAGIRSLPGTVIKNNATGEIVYTPPQNKEDILNYLENLIKYINENDNNDTDPLIKLAMVHYQFESIHPFYDGNGRTGRIINILYLTLTHLLDAPILYLSKYIIKTKFEYYELFKETRITNNFEKWIIYILKGIEETSLETIDMINKISEEMLKMSFAKKQKYIQKIY